MSEPNENMGFTNRHTWVLPDMESGTALIGITEYLANKLDAIESLDMPVVGDELDMDSFCIHLHLTKKIHHLRSPLSGRVLEINKEVLDTPALIHRDPYANWLYKMEFDDPDELEMLLDANRYTRFIDQL